MYLSWQFHSSVLNWGKAKQMIDKQSRTGKEDQGKAKTMMFLLKKLRCAKDPLINPINPHVVVVFVDHHI